MSGTRCCGSCATACRARSCSPGACCPRRARTWRRSCARSPRGSACRSRAWSATASTRCAGRCAWPCPGGAPAVPVPLPARGGAADLRGRPPRQEGAEEAGPRRAPDRALGRGTRRPRGRGGARLLRGRPLGAHRRRAAAAGGLGVAAQGPARGGGDQPRPGRGKRGLSRPLRRLRQLLARGLEHTRGSWPPIRRAYAWVHRAARILGNAAGEPAATVRRRLDGLLAAMARHRAKAGPLAGAVDHFLKVTRSYRPGLFHCYAVADLPRTNNDLERLFGSYRRHERRATGRKANSSATVLRGPVRLTAGLATRLRRRDARSEEHTSELQSRRDLVCRLLLEKKKKRHA